MSLTFDYAGKTVIVTGGTQGIGLGIARAFAEAGAIVAVTGTRERADDYDDDLAAFGYHQVQLHEAASRKAFAEAFSGVDILVNNAGLATNEEYDFDGYSHVMEVNLNATVDLCYRFYERLKAASGAIVNVGSGAGFIAIRKHPGYTASKTGILGFTRAIGDKWAADGVRVNLVAPGFVKTRITEWMNADPGLEKGVLGSIPVGRLGTPSDVAAAVLFLASPEAGYICGQSLIVDGGLLLR